MPMDHVCEDLRTDHPFPSFTPSISSSPFPQMAALCEDEVVTKFEETRRNHDPPAMPDPPLSDTQGNQALLMLSGESPEEPILTDTATLANTSLYPQAHGKAKVTGSSQGRSERGQEGPCQVCGERASGNFFGALVCLPCKSFFIRCTKDGGPVFLSQCQGRCNVSKQGRNRCQQCRYLKCQAAGMSRKEKPEAIEPGEGQILCRVCGDIANGIHFGVFTCEGCKKFFRRGLLEYQSYVCKGRATCTLNPRNRNDCRYCRYQKCLHVGMSRRAIKMGRPKKLNKDLEGALLTASRPHEMNSSSAYIPRISLDAMARMEDQSSPSSEDTFGRDEDINPRFLAVSSECKSSKRIDNYDFLEAWTGYDNSRGVLPLKKEIWRSVCSEEQETTLRAKWNVEESNENSIIDERVFIDDDDRSKEMYDQHSSIIIKSDGDGPHLGTDKTHFNGPVLSDIGRDRRKQRRRRCKSDSPSFLNIVTDEHPGLKRWKSDTDSPVSFKYSAPEFSENTSESNFEMTDSSLFTKSGRLQSRAIPLQTDHPVNLSLLTCFESRWNDRSYRDPVACFPIGDHNKQHLSMRGHHEEFQRSPVPSLASYRGSRTHLNDTKTTRMEKHMRIDANVTSTKPASKGTVDTEKIVPQKHFQSCSNKDPTHSNASQTSVCKDEDTPKQTVDGFLISKKNLEEIDHFFLSSMSLFIDIQRRIKASNQDTSISKEHTSSPKHDIGSISPTRPQSCSPGVEFERLSPISQPTPSKDLLCKDNGHSSATKESSSSPHSREKMSDTRPNQSPPDLSSSHGVHLAESGQVRSPKGHTPSPSGHTSQPRTQASGNHPTSSNGMGDRCFLSPRELKTAERLDSEYRFPAVRVCEYWNRVASSSQGVQMSIQEHQVLQGMLEAYMEMLKNLDESHMPTEPNITNLLDWPREGSSTLMEHVVRRIVRQVKEELAFMVKVPGFNDFHPDDRIFIIQNICFANVTLMATRDWYDPGTRTFRNMMNWKLPEFHPMYSYRLNAMDLGDQIALLRMDRTEAAMLSALNVTATDISGLREPEVIEKSREFLMSALAAHLSYKGLDPEKRMKELFNLMPIFRLCGFWTKSLREQIALNRQPNV